MYDNNQLGRNIQRLREIYGDTLDDLGNGIGFAKSTVKGYENGSRKPVPDTLKAIATRYGKTVDELLSTDLTDLGRRDVQLFSLSSIFEIFKILMPLSCSTEVMKNAAFKKAYDYCQRILNAFDKGETIRGSIISDSTELFLKAIEETESPESVANLVWCIFVWWSQLFDSNELLLLQNRLLTKRIDMMELFRSIKKVSPEVEEKRQNFVLDVDELLCGAIKALKSDENWSDLGDYYLALRFINGLVDTKMSSEMNTAIGIQLMLAYSQLGNKYAKTFLRCCQ